MYNPQSLLFPLKQLFCDACFPEISPVAPWQNITPLEDMVCITKMLFSLQLGVVRVLYWDFLGIFKVYLIEENLFLHNFSGCYGLSEVQLNDIVLFEEFKSLGNHFLCSHQAYDEMHHYYPISNERRKTLSHLLSSYSKLVKETDSLDWRQIVYLVLNLDYLQI